MARSGIIRSMGLWPRLFFIVAATALLLGACRTVQVYEGYIPSLNDATISRLEGLLKDGEALQVVQDIHTLRRTGEPGDISGQRLDQLEDEALEIIVRRLEENLQGQRYLEALALYRSLEAMGEDYLPDEGLSEQSLRLSAARKELEEGGATAALMLFFEAAGRGPVALEDVYRFGEAALERKNSTALRKITGLLKDLGEEIPGDYASLPAETSVSAAMLGGTATIWLDKGIILQGRVGYPERVVGSGFFIDRDGYVITNYHVISSEVDPEYEGYSRLYVRLPEDPSKKIPARVVGWSRIFDLALLKTEIEPEYIFMFEDNVSCDPGDPVLAIGSPAGLESTITSGIVSAKDRDLLQMGNAIQVDVPINMGNSGGPLLDRHGRLVGVVFAGIEQFEGVNFGIPSEWLIDIVPAMFKGGETPLPWIGAMGVPSRGGLEIMYLVPGSPAYRAGLKPGDILTHLAGRETSRLQDVHLAMLDLSPDTLVLFRWLREGEEMKGLIKLEPRPHEPMEMAVERDVRENLLVPLFGMRVEESGREGLEQNYIVTRIYSGFSADETGLSPNDPFSIRDWTIEEDEGYAAVRIRVKKRKAGFIESVIQLAAYLESPNFF